MAEKTPVEFDAIVKLRHYTAAEWTAADPLLYDGELGIETDTKKYKFGTGAAWNSTPYADCNVVVTTREPLHTDTDYRPGQLWLNRKSAKLSWLADVRGSSAFWFEIALASNLETINENYMSRAVFAKDGGAADGKVDSALKADLASKADGLSTARKITLTGSAAGEVTFNGLADVTLPVTLQPILAAPAAVKGMPQIAVDRTGRVTSIAVVPAAEARTQLGLGSAALKTAGNAAGNVPVIGADGKLDDALISESVVTDARIKNYLETHSFIFNGNGI